MDLLARVQTGTKGTLNIEALTDLQIMIDLQQYAVCRSSNNQLLHMDKDGKK